MVIVSTILLHDMINRRVTIVSLDVSFIFSRHEFFGRFNNMRPNTCRFDSRDYWYTFVHYIRQYYCSSSRGRNTASVLCIRDDTCGSSTDSSDHVARTTPSVRNRYPSTRLIVSLLICSVSSWFSFGIPIRSSKQYRLQQVSYHCCVIVHIVSSL